MLKCLSLNSARLFLCREVSVCSQVSACSATPDTEKWMEEQKTIKLSTSSSSSGYPKWQPSMNFVPAVPNAMWNTPVYGQPPQSFHQHPPMQQWPTASNNRLPSNPPVKQNGNVTVAGEGLQIFYLCLYS